MSVVDAGKPRASLIYNPTFRGIAYQVLLCAAIVFLAWSAISNAIENLARARLSTALLIAPHARNAIAAHSNA